MKLKAVNLILSGALVLCCTACADGQSESPKSDNGLFSGEPAELNTELEKSQYQDYDLSAVSEETIQLESGGYVSGQIYGTLDKASYSLPDDGVLNLTMHNETGNLLNCDDYFQLEILLDDVWYVVPPRCEFIDVAHIEIGEEDASRIDLSEIYVDFISGTYRVIKIYGEEVETGEKSSQFLIGSEFQLTVND